MINSLVKKYFIIFVIWSSWNFSSPLIKLKNKSKINSTFWKLILGFNKNLKKNNLSLLLFSFILFSFSNKILITLIIFLSSFISKSFLNSWIKKVFK